MSKHTLRVAGRLVAFAALAFLATACAEGPGVTDPPSQPGSPDLAPGLQNASPIAVMTRNVYLGADIGPILTAPSPAAVPVLVAQAWAQIQANDFEERAAAIAAEVHATRPDVIGLQEVALFRRQSPGDFLIGNPQSAQTVAYDYLEILLDALEAWGLDYRVATAVDNIDVELPMATSPATFDDIRYTDRDVVLVERRVEITAAASGNYAAAVPINLGGASISLRRGWNRVDLVHRGNPYHFVNTHLETDETSALVQGLQTQQLIAMVGTVGVPTIVVGDLNGTPDDVTDMYGLMTGAGFSDLWAVTPGNRGPGFTCCFGSDLQGEDLFERIDYIMARSPDGRVPATVGIRIVGETWTPSGLRPSDHAGISANVGFTVSGNGSEGQ